MYVYVILIIVLLAILCCSFQNKNTMPIDVVYTWVDGDDPQWLRRKRYYSDNLELNMDSDINVRFKNIQYKLCIKRRCF